MAPFPARKDTHVLFAHVAYEFTEPFTARNTGMSFEIARNYDELVAKLAERRRAVGVDDVEERTGGEEPAPETHPVDQRRHRQYDKEVLKANGIRLASGHGVNANAVAEHAISLMLSLSRQLHFLRDTQHAKSWRGDAG